MDEFIDEISIYDTYVVDSWDTPKEFLDEMVNLGYLKSQTNGSYIATNKLRTEYNLNNNFTNKLLNHFKTK